MRRRFWTEGPGSFIIAIGMALGIRWALLEAYVIPTPSMIPSLLVHDHIFVSKIAYGVRWPFSEDWLLTWGQPERGEVVVFRYPGNKDLFYVKRIIGIPGDKVLFENGNLYLNSILVEKAIPQEFKRDWDWVRDEDFPGDQTVGGKNLYVHWQETIAKKNYSVVLRKDGASRVSFGPVVVPEGHYFVLGDNRDNSEDSRAWDGEALAAEGTVTFWREKVGEPVNLPLGSIVSTVNGDARFATTAPAVLSGLSVEVPVRAAAAGANGNQPSGQITKIDDIELSQRVHVNNASPTTSGVDKRFVPRQSIMGRASFVLLSCEETLPVVSFLCNPLAIRWSRFFHSVH